MVLVQRATYAVHCHAARGFRTHIYLVPYAVFVFVAAVAAPADREAQSHVDHLGFVRQEVLFGSRSVFVRQSRIARRDIIHSERQVDTVIGHKSDTGAYVAVFAVVHQRVGSSDVEPVNRSEGQTESHFLVQPCIVETGSGNDTDTHAVVPEISIKTYVQTSGSHLGKTFPCSRHVYAVQHFFQILAYGAHQAVCREIFVRIMVNMVARIAVFDLSYACKLDL